MVIFFTTTLLLSIVGMVLLLVLKRYELATGAVIFPQVRPQLGIFFQQIFFWIEEVAPKLAAYWVERAWQSLLRAFHRGVALVVLLLEKGLENALNTVRDRTTIAPKAPGDASAFLREVAEHKKMIQEGTEERAIYEE